MKKAAQFVKNLQWSDLDEQVIRTAKNCLLDFIGAVLGGVQTRAGEISLAFAKSLGGWGSATIWPVHEKGSCQAAAFVHGTMGTVLDIDDGHRMAVGHPGGVVIPAAFAVAESRDGTGRELIEAIVCGYEVGIRAGHVIRLQQAKPISIGSGRWGALGAAAAASRLMGLDPAKIEQALAISGTLAPVAPVTDDIKVNGIVPMTKFCSGWGSLVGIQATLLAEKGFTGITSVIDFSLSKLPEWGRSFEIKQTYFKPFVSCRYVHPVIEATLTILKEHPELTSEKIRKITVNVIESGTHLNHPRPETLESAQYSIPYLVGIAATDGEVAFTKVNEGRLHDPKVLQMAERVEIRHSEKMDAYFPKEAPAEVEIETNSGDLFRKLVVRPKGDPQNPMSEKEFLNKFRSLATQNLSPEKAEQILGAVMDLEHLTRISDLTALFGGSAS